MQTCGKQWSPATSQVDDRKIRGNIASAKKKEQMLGIARVRATV